MPAFTSCKAPNEAEFAANSQTQQLGDFAIGVGLHLRHWEGIRANGSVQHGAGELATTLVATFRQANALQDRVAGGEELPAEEERHALLQVIGAIGLSTMIQRMRRPGGINLYSTIMVADINRDAATDEPLPPRLHVRLDAINGFFRPASEWYKGSSLYVQRKTYADPTPTVRDRLAARRDSASLITLIPHLISPTSGSYHPHKAKQR
ncbi:MAG TPA: hypothetical protein VLF71_00445 [Candidatus Saccharimonadales bacterium]|nr:hypothetical protein [Candidatus Saccharimonadales bacterium]